MHELKEVSGGVWLVEPLWQSRNHAFVQACQDTSQLPAPDWNSALGYDAARLASLHWKPQGPAQALKDLTTSKPYTGLLGEYDLSHKSFKPFPFRYRLVEVQKGQRKLGAEL